MLNRLELGNALDPFLPPKFIFETLRGEGSLGKVVDLVAMADLEVRETGIYRGGNVARERPRRCRPNKKIFARASAQREADEQRPVRDPLIALVHFHLADAYRATRAPRH